MRSEQDKTVISSTPIITQVLKLLRASLPTTIEIKQNIEPNPDPIFADPTQIHQVIMNLCTNSAHAMEDSGGILQVSLSSEQL
jgi:signal transduction histidine kinase